MVERGYRALVVNYRTAADRPQPTERFRRMAAGAGNRSEAEIIALAGAGEDVTAALRWLARNAGNHPH